MSIETMGSLKVDRPGVWAGPRTVSVCTAFAAGSRRRRKFLRSLGSPGLWLVPALLGLSFSTTLFAATVSPKQRVVPRWSRFEQVLVSAVDYTNALQQANLSAVFTSPLGQTVKIDGFWDGGRVWRVRFCPDMPGQWTFTTLCSDPVNRGLDGQTGKFLCTAPVGNGSFERHGPVRVAHDRTHFEHADSTPFFWLADTVWEGARLSGPKDWERYAVMRSFQDFNVAEWSVAPGEDFEHQSPLTGFPEQIGVNPAFFRHLDTKLEILSREGILSGIRPLSDPDFGTNSNILPDQQAVLLVRYLVARWGTEPVAWLLDFGGESSSKQIERWKKIGSAVFTNAHAPVVVLTGQGQGAVDSFRDQSWVDAFGCDTSEGIPPGSVASIAGDGAQNHARPLVVLAPRENSVASSSHRRIGPDDVRPGVYDNLLLAPPAGVTYAAQGVIDWDTTTETKAADSPGAGLPLWERALFLPGAKQMRHLADLMDSIDFWRLRPQPGAVANQPGSQSSSARAVAASTQAKDLLLLYLPQSAPVDVYLQAMPPSPVVTWLDPRQGSRRSAVAVVSGETCQFPPPGPGDWLFLIKSGK